MMVWVPKHCQAVRAVPISKTSSWASPAALAPYRAAATGQGHRAGGPFKLYSQLSWSRAGSNSQKHWRVLAFPVRKTSSWVAPAAVAPYLAARIIGPAGQSSCTVHGHGPGGDHDQTHRSTGACWPPQLGRLQNWLPPLLFKLHRTEPRPHGRANIQSVGTVQGFCPGQDRTHRITGACGPRVSVHYINMYHLVHVQIYMNL